MRPSIVFRALVILVGGLLLGSAAFYLMGGGAADEAAAAVPSTSTSLRPDPSATDPTTVEASGRLRGKLVIHGVGDINTDPDYIPELAEQGYAYPWSGLDGLLTEDDLSVVNLECAPSRLGRPLDKEFVFRCDPDSLSAMRDAGVDVASLANNHSGDYGKDALLDGRHNLVEAGVAPVGAGFDVAEAAAPVLLERNGWTIAVLGFGGIVPGWDWIAAPDRPGMADGDDIASMVEAVRGAAAIADLVVVTVHWGVERDLEPRPDDRERARVMIEAGADVIFGHHPHRLQPLEMVDGAPVFWSLGNFVWPNLSEEGSTTAVARVVVQPDGKIDACLIPAFISRPGRPELSGEPPCPRSPG